MKLLYLMHVPWSWIKQRPQFLAEGLSQSFKISIVTEDKIADSESIISSGGARNYQYKSIRLGRWSMLAHLSFLIKSYHLKRLAKRNDTIWFTYPNQIAYFDDKSLIGKKVVYDCMDDAPMFYNGQHQETLFRLEAKLCQRADVIFTSSQNLQGKVRGRYNKNSVLVNNAIKDIDFKSKVELKPELQNKIDTQQKKLLYIGTVSSWFDFELLIKTLDEVKNVHCYLIGPKEVEVPNHDCITWIPPVAHDQVFPLMDIADALVMPFVLNEIVLGVNPVKAYEYIYSGKPVILPFYGESKIFEEYVYLYRNSNDFFELIYALTKGELVAKKDSDSCKKFILNNTWSNRINQIVNVLNA